MLAVNDRIKNAYNQYTTQRKSKIRVGNNEYFIQNMDLYADAYDEGNIVGNTIAKILKFNIETQYVRGLDEFELLDGIWTGEEYEYVNLGTFKLFEEQGADDFFSSITAYDKLILFNEVYNPELTIYPTTVYGLLENICQQAGVTLATSSIANGSKVLNKNIFVEGETLKDILKAICQISGNFAIISNDTLKLKLQGTDNITLSKYQLNKPEYKRTTWKVNQVVLGMQNITGEYVLKQDDEDVELNGVHKIVINNNPFVYTQDLRQEYIDELFDVLKGFGYVAFQTNWEGLPYAELGDLLTIDGYNSMILRYEIKSPDGLNSILQAPSIIDSIIDYVDNTNDIEKRQSRTEYTVDKHNKQIQALITSVEENSEKIDGLEPTQEATGIEELYLPNSAGKDLIEYRLKGKSKQAKYQGNQLVDFNNISNNNATHTFVNDVLTVTANGGNYNNVGQNLTSFVKSNASKTLKFVFESIDISQFESVGNTIAQLVIINNGTTTYHSLYSKTGTNTPYIIPNDTSGITSARFYIYSNNSSTVSSTSQVVITKPMLQFGTDVKEYEPFVGRNASPSPNYPQNIKSIGDVHNLFVSETITEGKSIASSTGGTYNDVNSFCTDFIDISNIKQLYVNGSSRASDGKLWGAQYDNNQNYVAEINSSNHILNNFNSNAKYIRLGILNTYLENLMISEEQMEYLPRGNYIDVANKSKNQWLLPETETTNGITFTKNSNGTFDITGTATANTSFKTWLPLNMFEDDTNYTLSSSYLINGLEFRFEEYSTINGTWIKQYNLLRNNTTNPRTTKIEKSTGTYVRLAIYVVNGTTLNGTNVEVQLEKGTEQTTFAPYNILHNYINLTQPLPSLPDGTADELIVKDGKAKIIQNVGRIVLDGTESGWGLKTSNPRRFDITTTNLNITNIKDSSTQLETQNLRLNSHFRWNVGGLGNVWGLYYLYGGYLVINDANSTMSTLNDFKSWLSSNNVLLQYALAEPVEIDLGEVSIKTIDGNDYLYITDPIKSDMYAKYIRNTTLNDVYYTKIETDTQINIAKDSITSSVSETYETKLDSTNSINNAKNEAISRANSYSDDVLNTARTESIQYTNQKVTEEITATSERITVVEETIRDGVSVVRTETGYTFDADGLKIAKEGQEMNSLLDNDGLSVKRNTDEVLTVRSEGVNAENITVRNYFKLDPVRFEKISSTTDSTQDGLGIFYTGGDI